MNDVVLTVEGLRVELDPSGADIDDEVTLSIRKGEVLGLVGESASGKTTAATALLDHERRGARIGGGNIMVDGRDILALRPAELRRVRGGLISYVPQDPSMSLNPALRIQTQLMEILEAHGFGSSSTDREERLREMMGEVLLPTDPRFRRRYPHQLSGGQQQRVALAMAFACRPAVIVLDEPTTGLDVTTQAHVLRTVRDLTKTYKVAALYVTHDLAVVANLADRIAVMYAGRLVEVGPKTALFGAACHPYTRKLLEAIPDLAGEHALRGIPGRAPVPGRRPQGCFFAARCDDAVEQCREAFPPYDGPGDEPSRALLALAGGTQPAHVRRARTAHRRQGRPARPSTTPSSPYAASRCSTARTRSCTASTRTVCAKRCIALVGESGSGKTTLARAIAGIHPGKHRGRDPVSWPSGSNATRVPGPRNRARTCSTSSRAPTARSTRARPIGQILGQPLKQFFRLSRERDGAAA